LAAQSLQAYRGKPVVVLGVNVGEGDWDAPDVRTKVTALLDAKSGR